MENTPTLPDLLDRATHLSVAVFLMYHTVRSMDTTECAAYRWASTVDPQAQVQLHHISPFRVIKGHKQQITL
jgi:hypothetical protein